MIKQKALLKFNKFIFLFFILVFSVACVLPNANSGGNVEPVQNIELPTVVATFTSEIEGIECSISGVKNKSLAIVDANPDGLRIRKTKDGEELIIIPHESTVFILSEDFDNWTYIAWLSPNGLICGYSATRYLKIVK